MTAPRVVVAGGHSAGHTEPTMNFADALRWLEPTAEITALGTVRGLDTTLIPARGYPLELIPPVPLPRKLNRALLQTPGRLRDSVLAAGAGDHRARPTRAARRGPAAVRPATRRPGTDGHRRFAGRPGDQRRGVRRGRGVTGDRVRGGEQRLNAEPVVAAGGALLVDNADLDPAWIETTLIPVLTDPERIAAMSAHTSAAGAPDADVVLARHVLTAVAERRGFAS